MTQNKLPKVRKPKFVWEFEIINNEDESITGFKETVIEDSDRFLKRLVSNLGYGKDPMPKNFKEFHLKFVK